MFIFYEFRLFCIDNARVIYRKRRVNGRGKMINILLTTNPLKITCEMFGERIYCVREVHRSAYTQATDTLKVFIVHSDS